MFKKAKLNGVHSKNLNDGNVVYYFDDGMVFAEIVVNKEGDAIGHKSDTFVKGSAPWRDLAKLAKLSFKKEHQK